MNHVLGLVSMALRDDDDDDDDDDLKHKKIDK